MKHAHTSTEDMARSILSSRKYRNLDLPLETIEDLISHALDRGLKPDKAVDDAREKLHNIVAPYLGDPDYAEAMRELSQVSRFESDQSLREFSLKMLNSHASTKERIPQMDDFYGGVLSITGQPSSLLDLACAMQPFAVPWMGLPSGCRYMAYDLHKPRVDLINRYFEMAGINGKSFYGDILLQPPRDHADMAFFFKEAHRFDQRQKGCNRKFWQALDVRWLVVSLPATNLTGRFDLVDRQRRLVAITLEGLDWPVTEILIGNELVFCIQKENG